MSANPVITYDVGGKVYKISKDIIDRHPNSMLARIASGMWTEGNGGDSIFINGDGEAFRHVLAYLVRGKVALPRSVPKQSLLDDLEYYGIENVDVDCICEFSKTLIQDINEHRNANDQQLKMLEVQKKEAEAAEIRVVQEHQVIIKAQQDAMATALKRAREQTNEVRKHIAFLIAARGYFLRYLSDPNRSYPLSSEIMELGKIDGMIVSEFIEYCEQLHGLRLTTCGGNHYQVMPISDKE